MRLQAIMFLRVPQGTSPANVKCLDINHSGFPRFDVQAFAHLETLLLRDNELTTIKGCGLETLSHLKVLDVRENKLSDLREVAQFVNALSALQTVGISGNPWAKEFVKNGGHRHSLLLLLPQLHERECALRMIDDIEIGVDEIINAWVANKPSKEEARIARFKVLLLTKKPMGITPASVTELDLSFCQLENVDLRGLDALKKLSLAGNAIKSLKNSHLHSLKLRALDISHNKLNNMNDVAVLLKSMTTLRVLLLHRNPAYEKDDAKTRLKWLATQLQFFTPVTLPLRVLCGRVVEIAEICAAAADDKRYSKVQVEEFRLKLVLKRRQKGKVGVTIERVEGQKVVTRLDISGCGFRSLAGLRVLPHRLVALDARHNDLNRMLSEDFQTLYALEELDLRGNRFISLKEILNVLKAYCPKLKVLNLENSTKSSKETSASRNYTRKVFQVLRSLHFCDGARNPLHHDAARSKPSRTLLLSAAHLQAAKELADIPERSKPSLERQNTLPLMEVSLEYKDLF